MIRCPPTPMKWGEFVRLLLNFEFEYIFRPHARKIYEKHVLPLCHLSIFVIFFKRSVLHRIYRHSRCDSYHAVEV